MCFYFRILNINTLISKMFLQYLYLQIFQFKKLIRDELNKEFENRKVFMIVIVQPFIPIPKNPGFFKLPQERSYWEIPLQGSFSVCKHNKFFRESSWSYSWSYGEGHWVLHLLKPFWLAPGEIEPKRKTWQT